jgi:hypothetical protein
VTCALSALFQADLGGKAAAVAEMKTQDRMSEGVIMVRTGAGKREKGNTSLQLFRYIESTFHSEI